MIKIKNLSKSYNELVIFSNINFDVKSGEKVMISGKSGCGKTSLLKIISGIDKSYSGNIIVDGKDISKLSEKELSKNRRENIGFVFQDFNLFEDLSIEDNISYISKLYKTDFDIMKKVEELMKNLDVANLKNKKIKTLSGGEVQRVAIARALFNNPKILLLDEASSHLDKENSDNFYSLLDKLHKKYNLTIISVNHGSENVDFFDKVVELS